MTEHKFSISLIGVIFNTETRKILIGKSKGDENWTFLEGNLTYEEFLDPQLKKAVKEKTGYDVANLGTIFAKKDAKDPENLDLYFLCEVKNGNEEKGETVEELKWINPSEAEDYLKVELHKRLKEYLDNLA